MSEKRQLIIEPLHGCDPDIGRMLWMMEDSRRRTRKTLEGIDQHTINWQPQYTGGNSIGTLLYHIAAIELDWLAVEIMENNVDKSIWEWFPYDVRDAEGRLTVVSGLTLDEHYARLDAVRGLLLNSLKPMTLAEFRRPRGLPDYDVSPEEVLHHLMQHEAEHRGEIGMTRAMGAVGKIQQ